MNIFLFPIAITLTITIIAAGFDIKKGIIPNKLTFSLFSFGIAINSFFSIFFNENSYVLNSIILSLATFVLSYILWKIKLWAGGDVKLLTAIAASISFSPVIFKFQFFHLQFPLIAIYPFPLTVIFNSILLSFPFLLVFLLFNSYKNYFNKNYKNNNKNKDDKNYKNNNKDDKNYKNKNKEDKNYKNKNEKINHNKKILIKKISLTIFFSSLFAVISGIYVNMYYTLYFLSLSIIFSIISSFLFNYLKKFRSFINNASNKKIAILNLDEGMILNNLKIIIKKRDIQSLNQLMDDFDFNKSNINVKNLSKKSSERQFKYILNSSSAAGLSIYDISFIKKLFQKEFIQSSIPIKIGIPFAPSIAIGLFIAIFIGDVPLLLVNILTSILNNLGVI